MFDKIVFYELRHYGDFHITRQFVRYVIKNIPAKKYVYVLNISPVVLCDFPEVEFEPYFPSIHPFTDYSPWRIQDNILYVNTSCGAGDMRFFNGTTIQTAHSVFSNYLKELCGVSIPDDLDSFIPQIDFSSFCVSGVNEAMKQYENRKKVLIVNGNVQSKQSLNFDMFHLIMTLVRIYPKYMFFIANSPPNKCVPFLPRNNVVFCKDILELSGNDIIETSYFSRYCDLIVGRTSGVYTLSIERHNIDHPKKWVCFSFTERDKDLGVASIHPELKNNFIWSNNFDLNHMVSTIEGNM